MAENNNTIIGISIEKLNEIIRTSVDMALKQHQNTEAPHLLVGKEIYQYLHISQTQFKRDYDSGLFDHCCQKAGGRYYFDPNKFITAKC